MNEAVKQKLNEILDEEIVNDSKVLSEKQIHGFEKKYNIKIPQEYRDYINNYCEVYIKDPYKFPMIEVSPITRENGYETINFLYSSNFIRYAEEYLTNENLQIAPISKKQMVPIGEEFGDLLCIGIEGSKYGKIYYIYHEDEYKIDDNYYLVANSFNEFILSFKKIEDENLIDMNEVTVELADQLLRSEK